MVTITNKSVRRQNDYIIVAVEFSDGSRQDFTFDQTTTAQDVVSAIKARLDYLNSLDAKVDALNVYLTKNL